MREFIGILIIITFSIISTSIFAQRGCCSWHQGVNGCDSTTGKIVCNDGTYSPTCTCATSSNNQSLNYDSNPIDAYIHTRNEIAQMKSNEAIVNNGQ